MTEMIERASLMLLKRIHSASAPGAVVDPSDVVREVIRAFRDPTEEMLIAGSRALTFLTQDERLQLELMTNNDKARFKMRARYRAMCDAALGDQTGGGE